MNNHQQQHYQQHSCCNPIRFGSVSWNSPLLLLSLVLLLLLLVIVLMLMLMSSTTTTTTTTNGMHMHVQMAQAQQWVSLAQAWIYPGPPACDAPIEYRGRGIHTLKPEYFTVTDSDSGGVVLLLLTEESAGCNGYSTANVQEVKQNSVQQYVTVSAADRDTIAALIESASNRSSAINTLVTWLDQNKFTGVELNFEDFGGWTDSDWQNYKAFLQELGTALHACGYKLMVDGPAIFNARSQGYYPWKYEDLNSLPVDYIVVLAYDNQYDEGCGAPIAPNDWVKQIIDWTKSKIRNANRIVIGIPSYGYSCPLGSYDPTILTKQQVSSEVDLESFSRDPASFELKYLTNDTVYFIVDSQGLNSKRSLVESEGIMWVSVWHLGGGNDWFTE